MGWLVNATARPLYPRERDSVPTVYEAGWAPGSVWTGEEYLAHTGIRSPVRPARSQSLHRLSYPGPFKRNQTETNTYDEHLLATTGKDGEGWSLPNQLVTQPWTQLIFQTPKTTTNLVLLALPPSSGSDQSPSDDKISMENERLVWPSGLNWKMKTFSV